MRFNFLMCSERSGSNLITKLMNAHPEVCGPTTKHIINPVARNNFRFGELKKDKNWKELLLHIHKLLNIGFSQWKTTYSIELLAILGKEKEVHKLIRNIFNEEAKANHKKHIFIKENHIYEFSLFLNLYFPKSKYLFLTRDPRDMALSWKKSSPHLGGVVKGAKQWKKDQQNTLMNYFLLHNLGLAYKITYEDLISNTENVLRGVCDFFEIKYSDKMLGFYKDNLTIRNSKRQEAWKNLSKNVIKDNKNKYLEELSDIEIKAIEKICYFEMIHLGYQPINPLEVLDDLSENQILKMESYENNKFKQRLEDDIKQNILAKTKFYQR